MEHVDPGTLQTPELRNVEGVGLVLPGPELLPIEGEETEHVDDGRLGHDVEHPRRVAVVALGEELERTAVDERTRDRAAAREKCRLEEGSPIHCRTEPCVGWGFGAAESSEAVHTRV